MGHHETCRHHQPSDRRYKQNEIATIQTHHIYRNIESLRLIHRANIILQSSQKKNNVIYFDLLRGRQIFRFTHQTILLLL